MINNFGEIFDQYPRSFFNKYGDWIDFFLVFEPGKGCFKISGTQDQVKESIAFIIKRLKKD